MRGRHGVDWWGCEAWQINNRHAVHPPHPNPLPAFGGPGVRLSRQRKQSLRVSGGRGDPSGGSVYFTSDQSPWRTSTMWKASSVRPMWSFGLMVTVPPVPT
ncbi:hypothetical protein GCM10007856_21000 [Azospirillum oryzae]|nr:hypothetical protein GCM10007856_21000 [Azospirillum oryzae]